MKTPTEAFICAQNSIICKFKVLYSIITDKCKPRNNEKDIFSYIRSIFSYCTIQVSAQVNSGFSLSNTYARNVVGNDFSMANTGLVGDSNFGQVIRFNDGSWFKGAVSNGRPTSGTMNYPNGDICHGHFDANNKRDGLCLYIWKDGDWEYSHYSHGICHGEGSTFIDGEYYDFIYNNGTQVSMRQVASPKYSKTSFDQGVTTYLNAGADSHSSSSDESSGSSSSRRSSSSVHGYKTCGVCHGSGKCNTCGGKGYYHTITAGTLRCGSCGQKGTCSSCRGTGKQIGYIGR